MSARFRVAPSKPELERTKPIRSTAVSPLFALWNYDAIARRAFPLDRGGTAVVDPSGIVTATWFNGHAGAFCDELHAYGFERFLADHARAAVSFDAPEAFAAVAKYLEAERRPGRSTWVSFDVRAPFDIERIGVVGFAIDGERAATPAPVEGPGGWCDMRDVVAWMELTSQRALRLDLLVTPGTHTLTGEVQCGRDRVPIAHTFSIVAEQNLVIDHGLIGG